MLTWAGRRPNHRILLTTTEDGSVYDKRVSTNDTDLFLDAQHLVGVSSNIAKLTCVNRLWLDRNAFTAIPAGVLSMTQLTFLNLSDNRLLAVPREIGLLRALTGLNLSDTALTSLPREIGQLGALEHLLVNNSELASIPHEMHQLRSLRNLWLRHNQLTWIPESLNRLPLTTEVFLFGNALALDFGRPSTNARSLLGALIIATTWPSIASIRGRATEILVGLQDIFLPALLLVDILDAAIHNSIPMHKKWDLVTTVKHFHQRRGIE